LNASPQISAINWTAAFRELDDTKPEDLIGRRVEDLAEKGEYFSIAVPPHFTRVPAVEGGDVTRFSDGGDEEVSIASAVYPYEMNPGDFTEACLARDGWQVVAKRAKETPLGTLSDLLVIRSTRSRTLARRVNVTRDGRRYFAIAHQCNVDRLEVCASTQVQVLASFRLLHPSGEGLADKLEPWRAIEPMIVGVTLPASFALAADDSDRHHIDVRFDARNGKDFLGSIHVRHGSPARQLISDQHAAWGAASVAISSRGETESLTPPRGFSSAVFQSAIGQWGETPVACDIHVFSRDGASLLLASTAARMTHDPIGWAVTRRALQIACNTAFVI
jgi:hypothetical protein